MCNWKKISNIFTSLCKSGSNNHEKAHDSENEKKERAIEKVLCDSSEFVSLVAEPPQVVLLPLPRAQSGEYIVMWLYLGEDSITYESVLSVVKMAIKFVFRSGLLDGLRCLQVIASVNNGKAWPVDRIVSVSVNEGMYNNISNLSVDLFKREIEMPPPRGAFQEIPEDEPLGGIFCKWYWDHSGDRPKSSKRE